ncbi:MAG: ABC transporter substrate-binding protein [Lachnospiraceae bacterium]|jgi:branched-chain amino acid transport system substrate-binding protein
MKKAIKLFSVIMALALVALSVAACGAKDSKGVFKLGGIGPLTGDAAIYGNAAMNGVKIAIEEINALDGEIKFEFKAEDDVHDPETSVNAYNNLMDWGMQILIGTVTSSPCAAVAAKTFEDRVFTLTPSASSPEVTAGRDNVFQVCFSDPNQGTGSADYISANVENAKVAIIYKNDDNYSQGIRDTFVAKAAENGLEIVYEGTFTADTATDFSVQVTEAKTNGATVLFLPMYYQPASVILAQAATVDYKPLFFGVDGMDGILTMEGFDATLAEGVMLLTPFSADAADEMTTSFVTKYKDAHGEIPNQFAADGYDAVYIIYEILKKAGCKADMSAEEICEALKTAITEVSVDGLTGKGMTWAATGEVSKDPMAVVIEGGVYVTP